MQNSVSESSQLPKIEAHLKQASALEMVRRSFLGAPVFAVISLVILVRAPLFMDYGFWTVLGGVFLVMLAASRVWFALGFKQRYKRIGEKAVVQFNILTILQSITLSLLAAIIIYEYWAVQEIVLTFVLSAMCIAAGTSATSVRRSAHLIFLICVLGPFSVAVFLIGGLGDTLLILGFLVLMTFLVQDGGQVRRAYIRGLKEQIDDQRAHKRAMSEYQSRKDPFAVVGNEFSDHADPSSQPAQDAADAKTDDSKDLSQNYPHKILVVDDDEIHRELMSIHLTRLGYQADLAEDGQQAVAAVIKGNYDLIFMDIKMPYMSGIESTGWIREHFDNDKPLRIIALTGDSTDETRDRCKRAGMDDFVAKPVESENLEAILRNKPSIASD